MAKTVKKLMSEKELEDWDELYEYVRRNIMGYDQNQSLSRAMVLRLKGLLTNKYMANNNIADTANYSFQVILNTFKFCMPEIQKSIRSNSFKDENHKFNYVLKIVESNINNVYMRMKNAKKLKEEVQNDDISDASTYINTYKIRENSHNKKNKYDDLW